MTVFAFIKQYLFRVLLLQGVTNSDTELNATNNTT